MILLKRGELLLPRVFCSVCKVKYILVKFTLNISTLPEKKRMFKVLSVNTQTAECICCISVICSFFSVQHLDGLNKTSISTILCNVLNVFSQNFSREFCALFSHKYWNFHICVNIFYIFFLYFEFQPLCQFFLYFELQLLCPFFLYFLPDFLAINWKYFMNYHPKKFPSTW
jgi:hypothetical protein